MTRTPGQREALLEMLTAVAVVSARWEGEPGLGVLASNNLLAVVNLQPC